VDELARVNELISRHSGEGVTRTALPSVSVLRAEGHRAHRHFRAVTSMSPIQIQKQIRPHEARARLLAEPGDVTDAGFAVGYDSASQFSREYPCVFGVPPSRDALALRKAAVLP
jgi:methylphosphotriester-DNA--protein-cysteine methyltransferase